ncbi:MAG: hypothetical protein ACK5M3_19880 [Dysgonomonas sp.]
MKKLDLTKFDVKKLDKKQMAEINGGAASDDLGDYMAKKYIIDHLGDVTSRVGQKGISFMRTALAAFL